MDPLVLLGLAGAGLAAGFVDAIAGGGGLIGLPALLLAGVPPVAALATNKAQGVVGTAIAVYTYWRAGFVPLRAVALGVAAAFAGGFVGAFVVERLDTSLLRSVVPFALIAIAAYFMFAPRLTDADSRARLSFGSFVPVMGFGIGFYDGLLGPGTGSFFTIGFIALFGLGVTRAAGHTKALNLASNLGALVLFMFGGHVLWHLALVMAAGQVAGGWLGARVGIRHGARIIRPLVVVVSIALAIRLLLP